MKLIELIELKYIEKLNDKEYRCNKCNKIYTKLGVINHHFYMHEIDGIKKRQKLKEIGIKNNNTPEMKKKISEGTKKAFQREDVKENFKKFVEREKIERRGKGNPMYGKTHTEEWKSNHSKTMTGFKMSDEAKNKIRTYHIGKKHTKESIRKMQMIKLGKKLSKLHKLNIGKSLIGRSSSNKLTIDYIKEKYPTFSKVEEMRYNPANLNKKEIQVRCKYNKCKNSKERDGWFTPKSETLRNRIYAIETKLGNDGSYLYCSDECKENCPLFGINPNNIINDDQNNIFPHTQAEYNIWRQEVLKRQKDEYGYNFCEICESKENLQVHHEKPQKTHPGMTLDPDNGIILCKDCHYGIGHKTGTECSTGNLANRLC